MLLCFSGCASMFNEALSVMPHRQYSDLLDGCTQLGNVSCKLFNGGNGSADWDGAVSRALRQAAWDLYGADAVVIMDVSVTCSYVYGTGIAYKCTNK